MVVNDRNRKLGEQVTKVEEKTGSIDFVMSTVNSKVTKLEKKRSTLQEELVYLQSQSMRKDLMFSGIPKSRAGTIEDTESTYGRFSTRKRSWLRKKQHQLSWNVYNGSRGHRHTGKLETLWQSLVALKTEK
ncbi:hypothetical protein DPMN_005276 [Dreissena polymorpha]|uniref:Uncharacterized protein n=1 Tax=Dreissena polymorpha TaxID=45954 RepID=A0A9D4MT70_DREPO|nr:hypothetical protein DPMN_005276 [Dreissena polymorpha]